MDALQMAKQALDDFEKAARKEQRALQPTIEVFAQRAFVSAAVAQAEAMERIAAHLGNIHQTLITPNADREPIGVADLLKRIADDNGTWAVVDGLNQRID